MVFAARSEAIHENFKPTNIYVNLLFMTKMTVKRIGVIKKYCITFILFSICLYPCKNRGSLFQGLKEGIGLYKRGIRGNKNCKNCVYWRTAKAASCENLSTNSIYK